jgi:PAS domain S-box-containing protein
MLSELDHLRHQVLDLQRTLVHAIQDHPSAQPQQATLESLVRERTAGLEQAVLELTNQIEWRQRTESSLESGEQLYQLLYQHNPFMYFTLLPDGTVVSANHFGADQLGYRVEDLVGQSILQVFDSTAQQTVLQQLAACVESPYTVFQWEIVKIRRDGTRLWVKEHARAIHDHADQTLILVACEDITEHKRTEKRLHETSRLLATLVEESALPIVSLDRDARVVSWNQAATRLFGWSKEEVLGRELPYVQPEEEDRANALWQAGTRRELTGPIELQRQHKDGTMLNLLLWPVFVYDEFDQLSLAVGLYVDQSDLKRAEEATVRGEARLHSFLDALDDLAFEFDQNGRCLNVWTHSDDKLPLPKHELIGKRLTDLLGDEAGSRHAETVHQVFATGKAATIDYTVRLQQGERQFSGVLTLIPGSDASCATVGCIVRDITESRLAEAKVKESEIRWRTLYEHAGVGIAQLSVTGQILRANRHLCELLGYSSETLLQWTFQALTHPDDLPGNLAYLDELLTGKRHSFSLEKRYRRVNNTWVWVDLTVSLVHGVSGTPDYLIAIIQNIDDRKHSYSLLEAAINSVADGLLVVDRQGKITSINQRFLQLWNIPQPLASEGDDEALLDFVVDQLQEPETFLRKVRELYAHPEQESFDMLGFKDGRVFERYSRPQILNHEIVGRVWSFRDITKHKRAEQALRESELRLQRFVAEAPVGLCILDEQWRAISANKALCELTGYEEREILGSTYALYTHPEDLAANIVLTDEFFRGVRSEYTYEKRYVRKTGEIIWVSVKATTIDVSGHDGPLLLAAVQDITERKLAMDEREHLSRDLHDNMLQTLYAIGMQLEAGKLAMAKSPRRSKTHLTRAVDQLNNLMLDVRGFITLLTQRTRVELNFGQALQQLITSMSSVGEASPDLDIENPVLSFITPQLGEQLLNIAREALSNSLRHARASHRWVHLRLTHNSIRLLIGDNGIGFSPARKWRTGRGLANMAARAQHMTASFTLDSAPRRGTTIIIDVPLKKGRAV